MNPCFDPLNTKHRNKRPHRFGVTSSSKSNHRRTQDRNRHCDFEARVADLVLVVSTWIENLLRGRDEHTLNIRVATAVVESILGCKLTTAIKDSLSSIETSALFWKTVLMVTLTLSFYMLWMMGWIILLRRFAIVRMSGGDCTAKVDEYYYLSQSLSRRPFRHSFLFLAIVGEWWSYVSYYWGVVGLDKDGE